MHRQHGGDMRKSSSLQLAEKITAAMATWRFIFIFLAVCLIEIAWNHTKFAAGLDLDFDPSTIILNLFLSLIAAVQGSIIMIAQNAQVKREKKAEQRTAKMIEATLQLAEHADRRDKDNERLLESMLVLHETTQDLIERFPDRVREIVRDELTSTVTKSKREEG